MKGSAVVQSLRSLASKLHPQLPLTPRESQQLLGALTTAFRRQLDQAHPRQAEDHDARPTPRISGNVRSGAENVHTSSATLADRHLATVLTNPLLAKAEIVDKPKLDRESARLALLQHPAKDPISVLEEYHENGAATIPIALLCLQASNRMFENLPWEERQEFAFQAAAGKRTLLWLWNSELYKTNAFLDNFHLTELLVASLIREGSESLLWDWLESPGRENAGESLPYKYRWKGRLLRTIVSAKLDQSEDASADAALDAFFRASEMKQGGIQHDVPSFNHLLGTAAARLSHCLKTNARLCANTDPVRYNRFLSCLTLAFPNATYRDLHFADLALTHPRTPTPLPALQLFREAYKSRRSDTAERLRKMLEAPLAEKQARWLRRLMSQTALQLRESGQSEDADWIVSLSQRLYPNEGHAIDQKVPGRRAANLPTDRSRDPSLFDEGHLPFPSFT